MIKISRKRTPEEYCNLCKEKGYDLPVEDYVNNSTKIKHKCSKGHVYNQRPNEHLIGQGCRQCAIIKTHNKQRKTPEEYYNECKSKGLDLPIEDYRGALIKIKHKCIKCGNIYEQKPNAHLRGRGCSICGGTEKKIPEEYYNECKEKGLDLPVEDYVNNRTEIKHKCNNCGNIYKQTPNKHLGERGCPVCKESKGERFIRTYLDKNNIKYIPQKKFKDLKDKTYLSYDFYLSKYKILIEYQGKQHYEIGHGYMAREDRLKKQQYHDKLKKEYAKKNGYKLLELHYSLDTQEKVNKYLNKRIKS